MSIIDRIEQKNDGTSRLNRDAGKVEPSDYTYEHALDAEMRLKMAISVRQKKERKSGGGKSVSDLTNEVFAYQASEKPTDSEVEESVVNSPDLPTDSPLSFLLDGDGEDDDNGDEVSETLEKPMPKRHTTEAAKSTITAIEQNKHIPANRSKLMNIFNQIENKN
jgi:hypothetical protein